MKTGGAKDRSGPTLFALGHGARPLGEMLALLAANGIERLVDVRTVPRSRRHPHFSHDALARSLEAAGIAYVWKPELGGFRKPRPDRRHVALRHPAFRGYADYMETEPFRQALAWLEETAREVRTAFMCAETLWWKCHRRLIADMLVSRGAEVLHLTPGPEPEPHRLDPAARRVRGGLVYDAGVQPDLFAD